MTVRKKKRHVSSLEKTQDDLEKTFPEFELCSYDKLAYLIYPELNKLANKSRVPRDIKERQKKFLSEITETLKHMPNKQVSDFLTSKEFVEFEDELLLSLDWSIDFSVIDIEGLVGDDVLS